MSMQEIKDAGKAREYLLGQLAEGNDIGQTGGPENRLVLTEDTELEFLRKSIKLRSILNGR